jgi:hypothetical protein
MQIVGHDNYFYHSDDIETNFVASEKEYLGSISLKEPRQEAIYSSINGIVEQHRSDKRHKKYTLTLRSR